MSWSLSYFSS